MEATTCPLEQACLVISQIKQELLGVLDNMDKKLEVVRHMQSLDKEVDSTRINLAISTMQELILSISEATGKSKSLLDKTISSFEQLQLVLCSFQVELQNVLAARSANVTIDKLKLDINSLNIDKDRSLNLIT